MNRLRSLLLAAPLALLASPPAAAAHREITNVSYDVTRELYTSINAAFTARWKAETGDELTIHQSHGGSSKQARAVIDGLEADVVTMNQSLDIDQIAKHGGRVGTEWAARLPNGSAPFSSTIVFVVRKGNPKGIRDWADLTKPGVGVILPNPKTSGNGRYSYLAAWGQAAGAKNDEDAARAYVKALFANVPVLDTGGRGATTTFAERGLGDVLLTFENEVALIRAEFGDGFEAVYPSSSIRADLPVAWVDEVVEKRGTADVARAYLEFLYTPEGQEIAARQHYRPLSPEVAARHADAFPALRLLTVEQVAGGWDQALAIHFKDGGVLDEVYPGH